MNGSDFESTIAKFKAGQIKWSASNPVCVDMLRGMAASKMSCSQIAGVLSTPQRQLSRSAVVGLAHRAVPPIEFNSNYFKKDKKERRSCNLSTHLVKYERVRETRSSPPVTDYTVERSFTSKLTKILARNKIKPTCSWAGCSGELEDPRRDCFCPAHNKMYKAR